MARNTAELAKESGAQEVMKETLYIPPARENEENSEFISINGVNYIVPKGVQVEVPRFVAEEYRRAQAAKKEMLQYSRDAQKQANMIRG